MNAKTLKLATNFAAKLNADAQGLKDPTKMIVDPGKFGRIKAPDSAKYAICRRLNPIFAARGSVTVQEVADAFAAFGL